MGYRGMLIRTSSNGDVHCLAAGDRTTTFSEAWAEALKMRFLFSQEEAGKQYLPAVWPDTFTSSRASKKDAEV